MSRLKIHDLRFCETVSGSQVQGGLSEGLQPELDILDWLTKNIPEFEKQSSENTEEYLLERFGDKKGANSGYLAFSKDGKKIIR